MGRAVATRLGTAGHTVMLGSRSVRAQDPGALELATVSYTDAAVASELVVLTTDWADCAAALAAAGPFAGKILLDCTNPDRADGFTLAVGRDTSGGEENARSAPGAAVVKALNHVWAETVEDPDLARRRPAAFVCSDDAAAKRVVMLLLRELGFTPVDVGGLVSARYTEPFAVLTVSMVTRQGWDPKGVELEIAGAGGDITRDHSGDFR